MATGSQTKGMLSTQAGRKSFFATLIDLYKSDIAFRGMTDFAVIGAIVMMFLHPPHLVKWPWSAGSLGGGGGQSSSAGVDTGDSNGGSVSVAPTGPVTAGPVIAIPYPDSLKDPRLGIGFLFDIDPKAFSSSSTEDQERLKKALQAVALRDPDAVIESLRAANGDDPNVALMRGAAFVMRNTEAANRSAEALWREAVNGGSVQAKALLGRLLVSAREGVKQDTDQGRRLIEEGAAAGDPQAMRFLGIGYLAGDLGVLDPAKAAETLKQAADAGDAMAMGVYSRMLAEGIGVAGSDGKQAEHYLRQAADAGLTFAQRAMGDWMIAQYSAGLTPDPKEAIAWFTKAYEKGHDIDSLIQLAYVYGAAAKDPPWKDVKRAMDYVRLCSGFSNSACQFNTGLGWKGGYFGKSDPVLARAHFAIASSLGFERAAQAIQELDDVLSEAQKQAAAAKEKELRSALKDIPPLIPLQYPELANQPAPEAISADIKAPANDASGNNNDPGAVTEVSNNADYLKCIDSQSKSQLRGAACDRVIAAGKGSPEELSVAYFGRGWMKDEQNDVDGAIADYTQALKLNPTQRPARNNRGLIYSSTKKFDLALQDFDALLKDRPDYKNALVNKADVLRQQGHLDDAQELVNKALKIDADYNWAKTVQKYILADMKKTGVGAGAGDEHGPDTTEITFGPDDPPSASSDEVVALRKRARSHIANKDYDSAIADFTDIIRAGNASWLDFDGRGLAYHFKKEYPSALGDYGRAIERRGHNALTHYNRALIYLEQGQIDQALADLDAAIDKHKAQDPMYYLKRGDILVDRGEYEKAIKDYDKLVDLVSADKTATADDKAATLFARGRAKVQKITADQNRCMTLIPPPDDCNSPMGFLIPLLDFEAAVVIKPDYAQAYLQIGWIAEKFNNTKKALESYTKAIKADPTFATAYNNRGVIYGNQGEAELALADYNDAIRNDPNNYFAWANRGVLFASTRGRKNRSRAISDLRRALQINPNYGYASDALRKLGVKQ